MQQGFTPSLKTEILKYFFNDTPEEVEEPTPLFLGLFVSLGSSDPNEISHEEKPSYSRAPISFAVLADGVVRNNTAVTFNRATQDWTVGGEKITWVGIFKSHEVENEGIDIEDEIEDNIESHYESDETDEMIACIQLPEPETVVAGETFQFNPQSITLQLI